MYFPQNTNKLSIIHRIAFFHFSVPFTLYLHILLRMHVCWLWFNTQCFHDVYLLFSMLNLSMRVLLIWGLFGKRFLFFDLHTFGVIFFFVWNFEIKISDIVWFAWGNFGSKLRMDIGIFFHNFTHIKCIGLKNMMFFQLTQRYSLIFIKHQNLSQKLNNLRRPLKFLQ
jgi:hypothetical protein